MTSLVGQIVLLVTIRHIRGRAQQQKMSDPDEDEFLISSDSEDVEALRRQKATWFKIGTKMGIKARVIKVQIGHEA